MRRQNVFRWSFLWKLNFIKFLKKHVLNKKCELWFYDAMQISNVFSLNASDTVSVKQKQIVNFDIDFMVETKNRSVVKIQQKSYNKISQQKFSTLKLKLTTFRFIKLKRSKNTSKTYYNMFKKQYMLLQKFIKNSIHLLVRNFCNHPRLQVTL